ncbi:hypothetical protein [Pseudomonas viridiflava]|jgi:hypothetical protein|uniref:hypothetical protein n=1 Tax=Pseudomonas viridiflava TaxID=33069 RepID=UPI000F011E7F|nr:hypothetical protein [Pseudomonas viridiflava]
MPRELYSIEKIPTHKGEGHHFVYRLDRLESSKLTFFQHLGFMYRWIDARIGLEPKCIEEVVGAFTTAILDCGWPDCIPSHLLEAGTWKTRMYTAWCLTNRTQQRVAIDLDYDEYHNYWPNLDFCAGGWDPEAIRWSSFLTDTGAVEFEVAEYMRKHTGRTCCREQCQS